MFPVGTVPNCTVAPFQREVLPHNCCGRSHNTLTTVCQRASSHKFVHPNSNSCFGSLRQPQWRSALDKLDHRRRIVANTSQLEGPAPRAAVEGDIVTVHYVCRDNKGEVVESSRSTGEPATFEIGVGEVVGNRLFKAFDEAVRGLAIGDTTTLKATGGEWQPQLMFAVPKEHEEIQRLEARYRNVGGLAAGLLVELANGSQALVCEVGDEYVQLDANNMLAGKSLTFELEVVAIEKGV